jgi:hypothetical protein
MQTGRQAGRQAGDKAEYESSQAVVTHRLGHTDGFLPFFQQSGYFLHDDLDGGWWEFRHYALCLVCAGGARLYAQGGGFL